MSSSSFHSVGTYPSRAASLPNLSTTAMAKETKSPTTAVVVALTMTLRERGPADTQSCPECAIMPSTCTTMVYTPAVIAE